MGTPTKKWTIEYYKTPSGRFSPVAIFIEGLAPKAQAKLSTILRLMREFGPQIGWPHVKKMVGFPLWEIRILGQDSIRILYFIPNNKTVLLLHGFIKKKQKTPYNEIKTALARYNKYIAH